jgi:serine phosphatase RsbU (regulator of sigma subunit)
MAGSLGNFIPGHEFSEFYSRFIDIPFVCLGPQLSSVPTVIVDNTRGMQELISHLVEVHRCSKIAFVRGPEGNQEAEERLRIFIQVLESHGITPDDHLIIQGDFSREAGENAVKILLENEYKFDALVAANDDMALGALKAFQENHIRVPDEVMVVGFDDIEESSFTAPPLTTVRQPLGEMGARAIEVIHDCLQGSKISGTIVVPASLVARQSCGCFRHHEMEQKLFSGIREQTPERQCRQLALEVEKIIDRLLVHITEPFDRALVNSLSEAFVEALTGSESDRVVPLMGKIAWKIAVSGGDAIGLYQVLLVMRQFAVRMGGAGHLPPPVESLLQNTGIVIADSVNRAQANRHLSGERRATLLRSAGQAIASAFDLAQLLDVIAAEVVNLEVDGCYISLYDRTGDTVDTSRLRLVLALSDGKRLAPGDEGMPYSAPALLPGGILQLADPHSLLIEPLFFREQQIGLVIFDVRRCRDGLTYEILRQHIGSALKGALLMKQVQEQASALESANRELNKLRDAEHAYLEAIKHELELGREIQASFLPRSIPKIGGWELVTAFQPAREVSGDFYDIFTLPDGKLVMIICDVSGKDVSAALFMALIRTLLRALAEQALGGALEPLDAVDQTNKYLINHHYGSNGRYMYATMLMAVLDPATREVHYINAGHNPAAVIDATGSIRLWVKATGPAVGIIPGAEFLRGTFEIGPQEFFFMYTDGVTEARSPDGSLFLKKRLAALLEMPAASAGELVKRVDSAVREHTAGNLPSDDITMLAIRNNSK